MGQEAAFAHFTLRNLANRLADAGFVVIRFDYDGTGDSVGNFQEPGRLDAWHNSVDHAIELARSFTSAPVSLLGFRLGGLLAAGAAQRRDDVHSLVLWDSPRSGASFIREQRVRQNTSIGGADPELNMFTALGLNFTQETRAELADVDLRSFVELPADVVMCAERPNFHALSNSAVSRANTPLERIETLDQDNFLAYQILPEETETRILEWFAKTYSATESPLDRGRLDESRSTLAVDGGTERVVRVGEVGLFGILSEPDEPTSSTTMVCVPDAFTPHVGLSRIWVDLSRLWCAQGLKSLRFDVSGCGDSPTRPGRLGHEIRIIEHIDEVDEAVRMASWPRPDRLHLDRSVFGCLPLFGKRS